MLASAKARHAAGDDLEAIPVTNGPTRIEYLAWSSFNPSRATLAFLEALEPQLGPASPGS